MLADAALSGKSQEVLIVVRLRLAHQSDEMKRNRGRKTHEVTIA
jgi:hypothetical protein